MYITFNEKKSFAKEFITHQLTDQDFTGQQQIDLKRITLSSYVNYSCQLDQNDQLLRKSEFLTITQNFILIIKHTKLLPKETLNIKIVCSCTLLKFYGYNSFNEILNDIINTVIKTSSFTKSEKLDIINTLMTTILGLPLYPSKKLSIKLFFALQKLLITYDIKEVASLVSDLQEAFSTENVSLAQVFDLYSNTKPSIYNIIIDNIIKNFYFFINQDRIRSYNINEELSIIKQQYKLENITKLFFQTNFFFSPELLKKYKFTPSFILYLIQTNNTDKVIRYLKYLYDGYDANFLSYIHYLFVNCYQLKNSSSIYKKLINNKTIVSMILNRLSYVDYINLSSFSNYIFYNLKSIHSEIYKSSLLYKSLNTEQSESSHIFKMLADPSLYLLFNISNYDQYKLFFKNTTLTKSNVLTLIKKLNSTLTSITNPIHKILYELFCNIISFYLFKMTSYDEKLLLETSLTLILKKLKLLTQDLNLPAYNPKYFSSEFSLIELDQNILKSILTAFNIKDLKYVPYILNIIKYVTLSNYNGYESQIETIIKQVFSTKDLPSTPSRLDTFIKQYLIEPFNPTFIKLVITYLMKHNKITNLNLLLTKLSLVLMEIHSKNKTIYSINISKLVELLVYAKAKYNFKFVNETAIRNLLSQLNSYNSITSANLLTYLIEFLKLTKENNIYVNLGAMKGALIKQLTNYKFKTHQVLIDQLLGLIYENSNHAVNSLFQL